jgi:hypothetical protein
MSVRSALAYRVSQAPTRRRLGGSTMKSIRMSKDKREYLAMRVKRDGYAPTNWKSDVRFIAVCWSLFLVAWACWEIAKLLAPL